jgi:hypothetical protein
MINFNFVDKLGHETANTQQPYHTQCLASWPGVRGPTRRLTTARKAWVLLSYPGE